MGRNFKMERELMEHVKKIHLSCLQRMATPVVNPHQRAIEERLKHYVESTQSSGRPKRQEVVFRTIYRNGQKIKTISYHL